MFKYVRSYLRLMPLAAAIFASSYATAAIKIACIGDSITASSDRYPTWLGQNLGSAYEVTNFGVAGTTMVKASSSSYWNTSNFTASSDYLPDVVIIMLGTNDSKISNWTAYGANYAGDYTDMIHHYQGLASHPKVFVMTSPPNFTDGTNYQPTVIANQIVPTVRSLSVPTGSELIDIFTTLTGHPELFSDGTHPTTAGSQLIASIVQNVLLTTLGSPRSGGTFEGESQAVADDTLDSCTINSETGYSGGKGMQYNGTGSGDYVTLRVGNIAAGLYDVVVGYKKHPSRAIVQVAAGTAGGSLTSVGSPIDEYNATSSYTSTDLGNWTATTSGDQDFKFTVTGHNASSTGYTSTVDYIKLTPVASYTITATAGAGGSIAPSGSVVVARGANQSFALSPNSGYVISDVSIDGASVGAVSSYTFGNVQANHTISATFSTTGGGLPAGWTDVDIGAPALPGSANYSSGTFTVTGGGSDIWGASDQFNYVDQTTSGDMTVTALVATQPATNAWTKSGVMFRGSTAANDIFVDVFVTPSNGIAMQYRSAVGGTCTSIAGAAGVVAPYWVRIARSGTTFTGYSSTNGTNWTQVGSVTLSMATSATAGLEVCAHTTTATNTSTFQNVSIAPTVADSNIAPSGTAYGWFGMTSSTATTNQTAMAGLNDNNLTSDVDIDSAGDAIGAWEAAGVIWSSAKTISSADFINGTITSGGDGFLTANLTLQYTTNGTNWTNTGWTITPTYPYSSVAGGQTYTASGTALSGVLGMRFVGQVRSTDTSYHWIVKEVQLIGH